MEFSGGHRLVDRRSDATIAPLNSAWSRMANRMNGGMFDSQIGWPELVERVAKIRESLPEQKQARLGILAGDDGEIGRPTSTAQFMVCQRPSAE